MNNSGSSSSPHVVLTFDDAISNHATLVAPLLKEYGFGATFFVTEFQGEGGDKFTTDKRQYMTWEQIRELDRLGFEIGNHTGAHRQVTGLSREELNAELQYLDVCCAKHGVPQPKSFAYPNGHHDAAAMAVLRERGVHRARIVAKRPYFPAHDDVLLIPSYSICDARSELFTEALVNVPPSGIVVFTLHGVPDHNHPWVSTSPDQFRRWMDFLRAGNYRVTALRDM